MGKWGPVDYSFVKVPIIVCKTQEEKPTEHPVLSIQNEYELLDYLKSLYFPTIILYNSIFIISICICIPYLNRTKMTNSPQIPSNNQYSFALSFKMLIDSKRSRL